MRSSGRTGHGRRAVHRRNRSGTSRPLGRPRRKAGALAATGGPPAPPRPSAGQPVGALGVRGSLIALPAAAVPVVRRCATAHMEDRPRAARKPDHAGRLPARAGGWTGVRCARRRSPMPAASACSRSGGRPVGSAAWASPGRRTPPTGPGQPRPCARSLSAARRWSATGWGVRYRPGTGSPARAPGPAMSVIMVVPARDGPGGPWRRRGARPAGRRLPGDQHPGHRRCGREFSPGATSTNATHRRPRRGGPPQVLRAPAVRPESDPPRPPPHAASCRT